MQKIVVSEHEAGRRLDKYLMKYLNRAPRSFIYKAFRKKNIRLSGKKADGSEIIKAGDEIWLFFSDERIEDLTGISLKDTEKSLHDAGKSLRDTEKSRRDAGKSPEEKERGRGIRRTPDSFCSIVYEDDSVILADKASGILTQKAAPGDYSLNEALLDYCIAKHGRQDTFTPSVCNRLDRNTSGLVVFAKTYGAARVCSEMLRCRTMKKYYIAAVSGTVKEPVRDRAYLSKDESINRVTVGHAVGRDKDHSMHRGQTVIETAFEPLGERELEAAGFRSCYGHVCGRDYTLVKVELITGKSHQIRAHLAFLGHPLLGDMKYGDAVLSRRLKFEYGIDSQLLHAWEIVMPDHIDKPLDHLEAVCFRTELPDKFNRLLRIQ